MMATINNIISPVNPNNRSAIDDLRRSLADSAKRKAISAELGTDGAHLDVAEVFGELIDVLGRHPCTQAAVETFRSRGAIRDAPCTACDFTFSKTKVKFDEVSRSATSMEIGFAVDRGTKTLEEVYRDAHRHSFKSCDHCNVKASVAVVHELKTVASALVLSVAWFSMVQSRDDVEALLSLVKSDIDPVLVFQEPHSHDAAVKSGADTMSLTALVVFQDHHYTAFALDPNTGQWAWHDRLYRRLFMGTSNDENVTSKRPEGPHPCLGSMTQPIGDWQSVVHKCRSDGDQNMQPMLPYLLFYDKV